MSRRNKKSSLIPKPFASCANRPPISGWADPLVLIIHRRSLLSLSPSVACISKLTSSASSSSSSSACLCCSLGASSQGRPSGGAGNTMGNCGTKPKTSGDDDAPAAPPAEPQTPGRAAEGERKEEEAAAAGEGQEQEREVAASQDAVAAKTEEALATSAETKEECPKDGSETKDDKPESAAEAAGELPASTAPASVA
ncbi:hypothetical protein ACP4OV_021366 [Aristida adscensionis]